MNKIEEIRDKLANQYPGEDGQKYGGAEFHIKKDHFKNGFDAAMELQLPVLERTMQAIKWMWDNSHLPHTADHFNIPANAIVELEQLIDEIKSFTNQNQNEQPNLG